MKLIDLKECGVAAAAAETAEVLRTCGNVAIVPTETVYGIVSKVDPAGSERIYALKHRAANKRLGWFVGDWRQLEEYGVKLTLSVVKLAELYTPGAITIIAPDASGNGIGFRVPDHPFIAALLAELKCPLLQTSANLSGEPESLSLASALAHLTGEVDIAVDGGGLPAGSLASTVVDARSERPVILRHGALDVDLSRF